MVVISIGFISTGVFLNTSFNDWTSEPIITTMDSIAAPINDIQFPTVTVCHNNQRQPDRWAYLETILNFVKFSQDCFFDKYNDLSEEYAKTVLDEKCDKKVSALKRTCLKKLPRYMITTLKRFEFDFDRMIRVKVNNYFEF